MKLDKFWFCFGDQPKRFCYYDAENCTQGEITDLDKMSDFVLANADREIRDFFVRVDESTICVTLEEKIEAEAVKHGKWEVWGDNHCCSECSQWALFDPYEHVEILSNFCPYCGAKMDKKEIDK